MENDFSFEYRIGLILDTCIWKYFLVFRNAVNKLNIRGKRIFKYLIYLIQIVFGYLTHQID